MDLVKSIASEHIRAMTTRIVNYVGDDQERFNSLMKILVEGDHVTAQRASWPVGDLGEQQPALIRRHIPAMIDKLKEQGVHDAVRRNLVKALQFTEIPEKYCGELLDLCYSFIKSEL